MAVMPLATLAVSLATTRKSPPLGRLAELILVSATMSVDPGVSLSAIFWTNVVRKFDAVERARRVTPVPVGNQIRT